MRFYAIIRDKYNKDDVFHFFSQDGYSSKKQFLDDLRANGYVVRNNRVYTEQEYDNI